jgi:ATP-dependent RNA helicase DOB1
MASEKRKTLEAPPSDSPRPSKIAREEEEEVAPQIQSNEHITCLHDVSYPSGYAQLRTGRREKGKEKAKPAKEFPFQLDPFQAESIGCLEIGESVMVGSLLQFLSYLSF